MKLFIGNLSWDVTEDLLRQEFQKFGELISVRIVTDPQSGRSRGFAFIEFASEDAGNKAVQELDNFAMLGRPIRVSKAREEGERPPRREGPRGGGGDFRGGGGRGRGGDRPFRRSSDSDEGF